MKSKIAFLSVSYQNRIQLKDVISAVERALSEQSYKVNVFVNSYTFLKGEEVKMMDFACRDIRHADLVIAEVSEKAIGVGIEIGYAVALEKPIIYIRNEFAEYSNTVGGIVPNHIIYNSPDNLFDKLINVLKTMNHANLR